jgi:hypothetical protein
MLGLCISNSFSRDGEGGREGAAEVKEGNDNDDDDVDDDDDGDDDDDVGVLPGKGGGGGAEWPSRPGTISW